MPTPVPTTASAPPPSHSAATLLAKAHPPATASTIFTDKILHKPLLLHPTLSTDRDNRALRRHIRERKKVYAIRKQKPRPLSAREKRDVGVYALEGKGKGKGKGKKGGGKEVKWDVYQGLNRLWNGYMLEVLGYSSLSPSASTSNIATSNNKSITPSAHGSLLASADFHGAHIEVVRSTDVTKVGIKGIVVRDTKFTFVIVTRSDEVKVLGKRGCVFRYCVGVPDGQPAQSGEEKQGSKEGEAQQEAEGRKLIFELQGSQFEYRPADRANRKFKWRVVDYL